VDPIRAAAQYNAKLVPTNVAAYYAIALVPVMQPSYAASAVEAAAMEGTIKGILELITIPATIPSTDFILYYAMGRQILRKKRRFNGPVLDAEVTMMVTTYTARGLNATALASIVAALV
jgi:hypothetical protein